MPIIQDWDVKFPYKRYRYYLHAFYAKSNRVPVITQVYHSSSFCVGNETAQVRILVTFSSSSSSFCLCMCGNDDGFVLFF